MVSLAHCEFEHIIHHVILGCNTTPLYATIRVVLNSPTSVSSSHQQFNPVIFLPYKTHFRISVRVITRKSSSDEVGKLKNFPGSHFRKKRISLKRENVSERTQA